MPSIASACRICLVGILALCAWTEGKELISTTVTDGASLGAALKQENVGVIKVKGKIRLSKQTWVSEGTVNIRNGRHVILQADDPGGVQAVLDMGTLVDAIHVGNGSHLELRSLRIPNCASRHVHKPSQRVRLRVAGVFALWPSITLAINSSMSFSDSVFYYWSDKEWDSCDKFRSAATGVLNPKGHPGMLEWSGSDTTVFIKGSQKTSQALIDVVKNKTYVGAFNTTRTNHTLVCLPDPFTDVQGGLPIFTILGLLSSIAIAAAIAQFMGFIELRPNVVASVHGSSRSNAVPILGSNGQIIGFGSRGSLGSGGPHHSHPSAVEHLSGMLRERQKALLGGLELGELLGRGSFGKVYRGRWRGAVVAVKIVTHDRTLATLAETLRESALSTSIQHPNVVTTFKVRTIRSQGGSNDQASAALTWTTAEEGCLDAAAGGQEQLLKRAMSIAGGIQNSAGQSKPSNLGRTDSGALEFTPTAGSTASSDGAFGQREGVARGAALSLPHKPHDSAASSASMTPPHAGFISQSLPATREPSSSADATSGLLGASTSLLGRLGRGSAGHASAENATDLKKGSHGSKSDAPAQAARAFAEASQNENAEPLGIALQMKAAAAIAAELPEAAGAAAETMDAKVQHFEAASQQLRRASEAFAVPKQAAGADERVALEEVSRPAGRRSHSLSGTPRASAAGPAQEAAIPAGSAPEPSDPAADDDNEPEPLSMSMKGGIPAQQQSALSHGAARTASDFEHADEPEPLSMAIKAGSLRPSQAMQPPRALNGDSDCEPLAITSRQQPARPVQQVEDASADEPEPLGFSRAGKGLPKGPQGSESMLLAVGNAHSGMRAPASGFMNGSPGLPGAGLAGQGAVARGSESTDDEPEPLSAARKASAGAPGPAARHDTPRPSNLSRPPGLPSSGKRTAAVGIPGALSSLARKIPSFGRKSSPGLPSTPEDGPGLLAGSDTKPAVPSALLTGHSTGVHGSAAAQIKEAGAQAAADTGPDLLETWLILEYCDQGSFDHAIRSGKFTKELGAGVLCLMDIAAGMEHLHSLGVLHADLKGANVLLKSSAVSNYDKRGFTCKLADFGLSRVMEHNSTHISTSTFGTAAYMPAELLMEGKMTKAADVYSFAMLMHELLTGQQLFEGMRQSQIICKVITGWRPAVPKGTLPSFAKLMSECWHMEFAKRPHFPEILLCLRGIYKELRTASG